jgi:translation elongation factor EF-1alpha
VDIQVLIVHSVLILPVSARHGDNLAVPSEKVSWLTGAADLTDPGRTHGGVKTVVEALDA